MHTNDRLRTAATIAAAGGGLAWLIDVSVITAIDDSFGLADSVLFLGGLVALVATAVLTGALVARGSRGARRIAIATGVALAVFGALTGLSIAADAASHALYHGGNKGLHGECGIAVIGIGALVLGALVQAGPRRRPARRTTSTAPSVARGSR